MLTSVKNKAMSKKRQKNKLLCRMTLTRRHVKGYCVHVLQGQYTHNSEQKKFKVN